MLLTRRLSVWVKSGKGELPWFQMQFQMLPAAAASSLPSYQGKRKSTAWLHRDAASARKWWQWGNRAQINAQPRRRQSEPLRVQPCGQPPFGGDAIASRPRREIAVEPERSGNRLSCAALLALFRRQRAARIGSRSPIGARAGPKVHEADQPAVAVILQPLVPSKKQVGPHRHAHHEKQRQRVTEPPI